MSQYIVYDADFELVWPQVPDYLSELWRARGADVTAVRVDSEDRRPVSNVVDDPPDVRQLIALGVPVTDKCLPTLENLEEATVMDHAYGPDEDLHEELSDRGVTTHFHDSEGFWSESVAELAVGLTISAMRRIPANHQSMIESHDAWDWDSITAGEEKGYAGFQGIENAPFWTRGTVAGTNVRAVGVGNIGSRYLDYLGTMGADVEAYDPYADEPAFHRIGAERVHRLDDLFGDAEIFAPLVPHTEETDGLIDRELIYRLPEGSLVVLVTRAGVTDFDAVRERVLNNEIALAADVFDEEPLPLDDPLLGRDNVVHTPHVAGRTEDSNREWARMLLDRFDSAV